MSGGRRGALSDSPRERSITIPLLLFLGFLVVVALSVYDVNWGGLGDWLRQNWPILAILALTVVLLYRAFQGVESGRNVRSVRIGGGNGGGGSSSGGGGGGSWMLVLYGVLIVLILWLLLMILNWFGALGSTIADWADKLDPRTWFFIDPRILMSSLGV